MKIYFLSDTHCRHKELKIPKCDIIIHCGDEANSKDSETNLTESKDFFDWYSRLPIKYKLFVPGNHSCAIYRNILKQEYYPEIEFLIDRSVDIHGIRIYGSPWTPSYGNCLSFMRKRHLMSEIWKNLPLCDILVTHGPPKGILDLSPDRETDKPVQCGCKSLYNRVMEIKPIIHAFGHIHEIPGCLNRGILERDDIKFINCACLNHKTKEIKEGVLINI